MASVAMLIGGQHVNVLAFSGSNYWFSLLHRSGIDEERTFHDKAVEQLQLAQAEWSRKRTERLDWIIEELRRHSHAVHTLQDVDTAMREYYRVTSKPLDPLGSEPVLTDFYTRSNSQKGPEITFIILGMTAKCLITYKLAK